MKYASVLVTLQNALECATDDVTAEDLQCVIGLIKKIQSYEISEIKNKDKVKLEDIINYLEEKEQLANMEEKIKEYISELDAEIDRCEEYPLFKSYS